MLGVAGFDYESSEQVRAEALGADGNAIQGKLNNQLKQAVLNDVAVTGGLERVGEVPIYQADAIVRRAPSLQKTSDAAAPVAWMSGELLAKLGVQEGQEVRVSQGAGQAVLKAVRDDRLPAGCVRVAAAHPMTAALGDMLGAIAVDKA
jgi:NADH-quinone oxidoreductase subunit G